MDDKISEAIRKSDKCNALIKKSKDVLNNPGLYESYLMEIKVLEWEVHELVESMSKEERVELIKLSNLNKKKLQASLNKKRRNREKRDRYIKKKRKKNK